MTTIQSGELVEICGGAIPYGYAKILANQRRELYAQLATAGVGIGLLTGAATSLVKQAFRGRQR